MSLDAYSQHYSAPAPYILKHLCVLAKTYGVAVVTTIVQLSSPSAIALPPSPFSFGLERTHLSDEHRFQWQAVTETHKRDLPKIKNVAVFIDEHGEVRQTYEKRNLWHPERRVFFQSV